MSNFWFCEIQKSDTPPPHPRKSKKLLVICKFLIENPAIFCHFWGQKYNSKSIDFFIFGRDFERILGILPFTDGFLGHIFCPKKQILKAKS